MLIPIAFLAFVALGLPDGILGIAWPSMQSAFGLPLDALGLLLAVAMTGYILSSFSCGKLLSRMGVGALLAASTFLTAISLAGYALLPSFATLMPAAFLAGLGGGAVDSALNTYAAIRFPARALNWLHASYSLGGVLGPLTMGAAMSSGLSWRWGYGLVAIAQGLLGLLFVATRRRWDIAPPVSGPGAGEAAPHATSARYAETLRHGPVWLGVLAFFLYAGLEFSVGQWSYSLLTLGRGLEDGKAALWVGVYWGAFCGGRVLAGFLLSGEKIRLFPGDRVRLILWICPAGMIAAAILIAIGGNGPATLAGLALVGIAFAPVYPMLVYITPARLGLRHASNAMGFQVAAATVGLAVVPGLLGVAAERYGLEAISRGWIMGSILVLLSLALLIRGKGPLTVPLPIKGRS